MKKIHLCTVVVSLVLAAAAWGQTNFWKDYNGALCYSGSSVGIGLTVPGAVLHIRNTGNSSLNLIVDGGSEQSSFYIDRNGNVGIGIPAAAVRLTVGGDAAITGKLSVTGNVGIGTANPVTMLDVNGIITASGGSSANWNTAFSWGNHASAGYLKIELDPKVGNLTAGYLPRWGGSALANSSVYADGSGNVGIGTTAPTAKLSVSGNVSISGNTGITGTLTVGGYALPASIGTSGLVLKSNGTNLVWGTDAMESSWGKVGNNLSYTAGNIGIGTTNPATILDVSGIITATGGSSTNWNTAFSWGNHASAGYLKTEADPKVGSLTAGYLPRWGGSALANSSVYADGSGNVGIGISSPAQKLDVGGTIQVTGFKMPTGAVAGYVLTVDANGVAAWKPPAKTYYGDIAEVTTTNDDFTKLKEIKILDSRAAIIVTWEHRSTLPSGGSSLIYVNGAQVGGEKGVGNNTYTTVSEVLTNVRTNDLIQIYGRTWTLGYPYYVRNMSIQ